MPFIDTIRRHHVAFASGAVPPKTQPSSDGFDRDSEPLLPGIPLRSVPRSVNPTHKKKLGEDHPNMLTNRGNLASTYRNQGR
jgi:hypothetical protein